MASLVGHQHPSVFHLVTVLQQDAAVAETVIIQDARGQAPAKAATCRAAASTSTAAAMLRRPRWPQECAGGAERIRTLRSLAFNHCNERYLA